MKKRVKKLMLVKETVRALQEDLDRVAGGATTSDGDYATCFSWGVACRTEFTTSQECD